MNEAAHIQSKIILGASCSPETEAELRKNGKTRKLQVITFPLFQVSVGHKTVNCCMSGGVIDPVTRQPSFTLVGLGAFEALSNYSVGAKNVIFQEVKRGKTPLQEKIKATILAAPDDSIICFVGDMAGELDGMSLEFNPTGEPILVGKFAEENQ